MEEGLTGLEQRVASKVLGEMLDEMTPENWIKGRTSDEEGGRCLIGACDIARARRGAWTGAYEFLANEIKRLFPDQILMEGKLTEDGGLIERTEQDVSRLADDQWIWRFNDHEDTTFEDIQLVVKHAYVESLG